VGDKAADVAHKMVDAMNSASEKKQDEYLEAIKFVVRVFTYIKTRG
jgi:hypothetical protein